MSDKREIVGSLAALRKGETKGFVGYPQNYVVGQSIETSFIQGVDQAGEPFTLMVVPPERYIEAAKTESDLITPTVALLADTGRRAQMPCNASTDNSATVRTGGAFLAEQVTVVDAEKRLYRSNWLSVLQEFDDSPQCRLGVGYLEQTFVMPFNADVEYKKQKLIQMNQQLLAAAAMDTPPEQIDGIDVLDYEAERFQLVMDLYRGASRKWFVGVDVQYRRIETLDLSNEAKARATMLELIDSNSGHGMYGGLIMRPVKAGRDSMIVQADSVRRLNHQYDYKNKSVPPVTRVWDDFIGKGSGWLKAMRRDGFEIEVIPVQRINCGPKSNAKYDKEWQKNVFPKQLKSYVDQSFYNSPHLNFSNQNAFLAAPIAIRTAETKELKDILLGSMHQFGKVIGNVLELDKECRRTLELSAPVMPREFTPRRAAEPSPEY
ncbi:hypothetical protein [Pseudomonas sp. PLMAX]|jgi:hypothetical protein|uniref:hypothetical protein n=1 Tax=Pseudomonas sp. PLMAX TaxID=2201998 RepID=UPI0038BC9CED